MIPASLLTPNNSLAYNISPTSTSQQSSNELLQNIYSRYNQLPTPITKSNTPTFEHLNTRDYVGQSISPTEMIRQQNYYNQYFQAPPTGCMPISYGSHMSPADYFSSQQQSISLHQPYAPFFASNNSYNNQIGDSAQQALHKPYFAPYQTSAEHNSSNPYDIDPSSASGIQGYPHATNQLKARSAYHKDNTRSAPYSTGGPRLSVKRHPSQSNDSCALNELSMLSGTSAMSSEQYNVSGLQLEYQEHSSDDSINSTGDSYTNANGIMHQPGESLSTLSTSSSSSTSSSASGNSSNQVLMSHHQEKASNESGYYTHSPSSIALVLDSALVGHQDQN